MFSRATRSIPVRYIHQSRDESEIEMHTTPRLLTHRVSLAELAASVADAANPDADAGGLEGSEAGPLGRALLVCSG